MVPNSQAVGPLDCTRRDSEFLPRALIRISLSDTASTTASPVRCLDSSPVERNYEAMTKDWHDNYGQA